MCVYALFNISIEERGWRGRHRRIMLDRKVFVWGGGEIRIPFFGPTACGADKRHVAETVSCFVREQGQVARG